MSPLACNSREGLEHVGWQDNLAASMGLKNEHNLEFDESIAIETFS